MLHPFRRVMAKRISLVLICKSFCMLHHDLSIDGSVGLRVAALLTKLRRSKVSVRFRFFYHPFTKKTPGPFTLRLLLLLLLLYLQYSHFCTTIHVRSQSFLANSSFDASFETLEGPNSGMSVARLPAGAAK